MMYFEDKNNKIYYEKYGNKKDVIIILPGWGFTRPTFNYLIDNQQVRKRFAKEALMKSRKYNVDNIMNLWKELFNSLLPQQFNRF